MIATSLLVLLPEVPLLLLLLLLPLLLLLLLLAEVQQLLPPPLHRLRRLSEPVLMIAMLHATFQELSVLCRHFKSKSGNVGALLVHFMEA